MTPTTIAFAKSRVFVEKPGLPKAAPFYKQ